jgi:putative ABC transport system ATP-binding protein
MATEPVIATRAVWRTYGTGEAAVHAVRGVDTTIARGEYVALVGPSGCGKSTLLHLLGGLDRPTRGEIAVAGHRLELLGESARAILRRREVGFVFQAYNLVPNLTVADNVELPGRLAGRRRVEVVRARTELLATLGLTDRAGSLPSQLSGGQQQRAAIARALVNAPTVLLADEPTGNLDSASGAQVLELLAQVHARGQTIVIVTHDPLVASRAGRVLFLRDGELVDEMRPTAASGCDRIVARMTGPSTVDGDRSLATTPRS